MNLASEQPNNQAMRLPGWVNTFYVLRNGNKYGPYHARVWKSGGRIYKKYIKEKDLERVRAACLRYREHQREVSAFSQETYRLIGNLNYLCRLCKREEQNNVRPEDHAFVARLEAEGFSIPGRPSLHSNRQSAIKNRAIQVAANASQYLTPKTQDPKKFMVPSRKKLVTCHPERACESRDLTGNTTRFLAGKDSTLNAERSTLPTKLNMKKIKAILRAPIHTRQKQETHDEKWMRWIAERREAPRAPFNVTVTRTNDITQEHVDDSISRIYALLPPERLADFTQPPAHCPPPTTPGQVGGSHDAAATPETSCTKSPAKAYPATSQTPAPATDRNITPPPVTATAVQSGRTAESCEHGRYTFLEHQPPDEHDTSTNTANTVQLDQSDDLSQAAPSVYGLPFTVYATTRERSFADELQRMKEQP